MRKPIVRPRSTDDAQLRKIPRLFQNEHGYWHWKPDKRLRPHWKGVSLGDNADRARAEARRLNREAEEWLRSNAATRPRVSAVRPGPMTVSQIVNLYKASSAWLMLREKTKETYMYELKRIENRFGHSMASMIDEVEVDEWIENLQFNSPEVARHLASRARALFQWAARKKYVPRGHNPFLGARVGVGKKRKFRFLWSDVVHILNVSIEEGRPSVGIALVVGFTCIQRISDVLCLTEDELFQQSHKIRRLIFNQSKSSKIGKKGDLVPGFEVNMIFPEEVYSLIKKHRVSPRDPACKHIIVSEFSGKPYDGLSIAAVFRKILARAIARDPDKWGHLKGGQLRDGRRSGFVHAVTQGATVELVCSVSGHSISQGYDVVEHYLPKTKEQADRATAFLKVAL